MATVLGLAYNAAWDEGNPSDLGEVLDMTHRAYRLWPESGDARGWGRGEE